MTKEWRWFKVNTTLFNLCFAKKARRNVACMHCSSDEHASDYCPSNFPHLGVQWSGESPRGTGKGGRKVCFAYIRVEGCSYNPAHYVLSNFIYIPSLYGILGTLVQEFLLYPFIRSRIPTILKRIGIGLFVFTLVCFLCFVLHLSHYLSETVTECIIRFLYHITSGLLTQMLVTAVLEFMCAQSPYNMRGLLLSLVETITLASWGLGWIVSYAIKHKVCTQSWCYLLLFQYRLLFGFLPFCVVARWYKRRVRDEDYSPQRVVEEVYDRYLTAASPQSRSYGTHS